MHRDKDGNLVEYTGDDRTTLEGALHVSQQFEPWADEIYREAFPAIATIERQQLLGTAMDIKLCIDGYFTMTNGMRVFFQEKFLTTYYRTVTIEFMSDDRGTKGEWYKSATQIHVTGYGDPATGFREIIILSYPQLVLAIAHGTIKSHAPIPTQNHAFGTSSFYAFSIDDIRANTGAVIYHARA